MFYPDAATDTTTNRKEAKNFSTPRRGRSKGRRSVSMKDHIKSEVNVLTSAASQDDSGVPNTCNTSKSSQPNLESVQTQNLQETSLWYFIIVLVIILTIFTGALIQKIDSSSTVVSHR